MVQALVGFLALWCLSVITTAAVVVRPDGYSEPLIPAPIDPQLHRRSSASYAPQEVTCPAGSLVRAASGISNLEQSYVAARKVKADKALQAWLASTSLKFPVPATYPTLGLATSGGGYRSLLCGAGVHQAFDARDSKTSTSGLYQAFTYETGLSGGSWLLSSLAANNWPTVSSLVTGLWISAFQYSLLLPNRIKFIPAIADITEDILAKDLAGFSPTITDVWGRLLSYQLLYGSDGGLADTIHGLTQLSNFTSNSVPFPIITALGAKVWQGQCVGGLNATQYEFTPYEFGSWDPGVAAFTNIQYLGSKLSEGIPISKSSCYTGFDNQGYVLGTSSNVFNEVCAPSQFPAGTDIITPSITSFLQGIVDQFHDSSTRDLYAVYPNPFYKYPPSSLVSAQQELSLTDGAEASQNDPIWPFLNRGNVDVLIVNDNSADSGAAGYPSGAQLLTTYTEAVAAGLTRMPVIPSVQTFASKGLNKRPTFFGCNSKQTMTIVYLPNTQYTFPSNQSTFKLEYTVQETQAMIANGVLIGTYGGDSTWGPCLACGIMQKTGIALPAQCTTCLKNFCFN